MKSPLAAGDILELSIGPIAHGGHFIAHWGGRTIFVRGALSAETVRARVTEVTSKISRAEVIEVLQASTDRVTPPCAYAGRCGGCDFQHVSVDAQRALKTRVLHDALIRQGGFDADAVAGYSVEPLPGGALGWRTRMRWTRGPAGIGLHANRSNDVIAIDECVLAAPAIANPPAINSGESIIAAVGSSGEVTVAVDGEVVSGRTRITEHAAGHDWRVAATGFWQVHPALADHLVPLATASAAPGEIWWDLYAGAGLFTRSLCDAVGPEGIVECVESAPGSVRDARRNLHDLPQARVHEASVEQWLEHAEGTTVHGIVLDPPRTGAGPRVAAALAALEPRVISYVACDPVALARDLAAFREAGYVLSGLRAFDAFPMTHHFECVATLVPAGRTP